MGSLRLLSHSPTDGNVVVSRCNGNTAFLFNESIVIYQAILFLVEISAVGNVSYYKQYSTSVPVHVSLCFYFLTEL